MRAQLERETREHDFTSRVDSGRWRWREDFGDEKLENNSEKKSEELVEEDKEQLEKEIVEEDKEVK